MSTFTHALSTNNYGPAKFIVASSAANGTHTTIASALTSASSGDTIFIRTGTYTENLTLKAGVNLTAFDCDAFTPNVTIIGKATFTDAGTASISGIRLQTNSDFFLAVTGSEASVVNLQQCFLNCSNNTGISITSSNAAAGIYTYYCFGNLGTTGIAFFASTSTGFLDFEYCMFSNTGLSVTANTISAGFVNVFYCYFINPITTSSTGLVVLRFSQFSLTNTTAITTAGTGVTHSAEFSSFATGSASSISIGAGTTMLVSKADINSSNTNVITGAGVLSYGGITFSGTSSTINTTTKTNIISTEFSKVVVQTFTTPGANTYTPTAGMKYCTIEVVGGGGGSGGCQTTGVGQFAASAGGGGGGYARKTVTAATIGASQTATVGAAGIAGTAGANAGGTGGTTSLGAIVSATGGVGGGAGFATISLFFNIGGAGGAGASGDFNTSGTPGLASHAQGSGAAGLSGSGGSSFFGGGANAVLAAAAAVAGASYGGGAAGGGIAASTSQIAGAAGFPGIVVVTEYI